jgi:predicted dithiol-disulfide oxidoreductase (DUF899 family)
MSNMEPLIVTKSEWLQERQSLLEKEKKFNQQRDELTRERQNMPWLRVNKPYVFDGSKGAESLSDLFEGRSQLIVYHFMFHESWNEGCVSCSFWADNFNGTVVHLNARDVSMVAISTAPYEQLAAYRKRLGWSFKWVSSQQNDFGRDFHVSFDESDRENGKVNYNYKRQEFPSEEAPGVSVFKRNAQGEIFHTYSTYSRGLDMLNGAYHYLDIVPAGRNESELAWKMAWVSRNDAYDNEHI